MSTTPNQYRGFRFPAAIINEAVWLYHRFSLSPREVELILAARGIEVSFEQSVRSPRRRSAASQAAQFSTRKRERGIL